MKPKPFDFEAAAKLENYVRAKNYRNRLSNGAMQLYFFLPHLERKGLGLCQPITANYRAIAEVSFHSIGMIKKHLTELSGVLCKIEIGLPIKGGQKATMIRRYTLQELMSDKLSRKLIDHTPPNAKQLAELLMERSFIYGDNPVCKPYWNVSKTGRVQSANPNIQSDPKTTRTEKLRAGLKSGQVLIHADFKTAEPTIIQKAIGYSFDSDPYQTAADLLGIDRDKAKEKVNMLAYASSAIRIVKHWPAKAQNVFMPYAEALDAYKDALWEKGKPRNKQRRFVHTLDGTKIVVDKSKQPHHGTILNWQIQGTVADITNGACLKILELEASKGWKLCFPVHDAVYVIGIPEQAVEINHIMEDEAQRLGLSLTANIETPGAKTFYSLPCRR